MRPNDLVSGVADFLKAYVKPGDRVVIGLSGGLDSVALLDILVSLAPALKIKFSAVHVNHQISPHANDWARFCEKQCDRYDIPCVVEKVDCSQTAGVGLEAAAREARYGVFEKQRADYLVLAHHLDDQVETMALRLLRGAGVRGLSAMQPARAQARQDGNPFSILRPLLAVSRAEIENYAKSRDLKWIEDESNADTGYDRNFLRHRIFPELEKQFPAYRELFARANERLFEASLLIDELAKIDIGDASDDCRLSIVILQNLDQVRAKNVLRYFLGRHKIAPSAATLQEILRQLLDASQDSQLCIPVKGWSLRRFKDELHLVEKIDVPINAEQIKWQGQAMLDLGEIGTLSFREERGAGIKLAKLKQSEVMIRWRVGGERFRPAPNRPGRSLKNLLQEAGLPPWMRGQLPLIYCKEKLVWVARIGIAHDFQAGADELGLVPTWNPSLDKQPGQL